MYYFVIISYNFYCPFSKILISIFYPIHPLKNRFVRFGKKKKKFQPKKNTKISSKKKLIFLNLTTFNSNNLQ